MSQIDAKKKDIKKIIYECIKQVALEQLITLEDINDNSLIVDDLGFRSLDIATLIAMFEERLEVDPFSEGNATLTDIRTVGDVVNLYTNFIK